MSGSSYLVAQHPVIVLWNSRMDHWTFHNSAAFSWYLWVQLPSSFLTLQKGYASCMAWVDNHPRTQDANVESEGSITIGVVAAPQKLENNHHLNCHAFKAIQPPEA